MAEANQFIVVCQQVVGGGAAPFSIHYGWDGERFADRPSAIKHGFKVRGSDDFNIGVVQRRRLISFDWMDEPVDETPETLLEIQKAIFHG